MASTPNFRVLPAGLGNSASCATFVVKDGSDLLHLSTTKIGSKPIVKGFLKYDEDNCSCVPAESPLDDECMRTAVALCPGKTLQICLTTQPPKPIQPTVCVDISTVIITPDGKWRAPQFVLEIDVPASGEFSLNHQGYTITLADELLFIKY